MQVLVTETSCEQLSRRLYSPQFKAQVRAMRHTYEPGMRNLRLLLPGGGAGALQPPAGAAAASGPNPGGGAAAMAPHPLELPELTKLLVVAGRGRREGGEGGREGGGMIGRGPGTKAASRGRPGGKGRRLNDVCLPHTNTHTHCLYGVSRLTCVLCRRPPPPLTHTICTSCTAAYIASYNKATVDKQIFDVKTRVGRIRGRGGAAMDSDRQVQGGDAWGGEGRGGEGGASPQSGALFNNRLISGRLHPRTYPTHPAPLG